MVDPKVDEPFGWPQVKSADFQSGSWGQSAVQSYSKLAI